MKEKFLNYLTRSRLLSQKQRLSIKLLTTTLLTLAVLAPLFSNGNVFEKSVSVAPITITGTVVDQNNQALPGVSVKLKGSTLGVSTNEDGRFSIQLPSETGTLIFSFLGFSNQEVDIKGRTSLNIKLIEENSTLNEVVVVGYGTQKKSDLTGSVASVSKDQIKDLPVSSVDQALKGQVAGVQITQNTGSPGAGVSVRIRGNTSIAAGNSPLYVIDGFPVTGGGRGQAGIPGGSNPLNTINPSDIESIDILKDASATAIYGSRGANGVIIITTKTGKSGKGRLTFNSFASMQNIANKVDVLSAEEFVDLHIDSRNNGWLRNGGNPATPFSSRANFSVSPIYFDPTQWRPTDWQDEVTHTGVIQSFNVGANGGTDAARYVVSAGYFQNDGIILESSLKRYSVRANVDAKVNEKINVGIRFTPSYGLVDGVNSDGHFSSGGVMGLALRMPPIISPYRPDGSYENPLGLRTAAALGSIGAIDNPLAKLYEDKYQLSQGRILSNMFLEYQILKNLKFKTSLGIDGSFNRIHTFLSSKTGRGGTAPPNVPSGVATSSQELEWLNENLLSYEKSFDKHRISGIAGLSYQKNDYRFIRLSGTNFPNDNVQYISAAGTIESGTENRNQASLFSYYGRVNYALADKYLFTATVRRDGSSRFGSENKYGTFPSAALAWRMSEENFMKNIPVISNLKWRISYGRSGNNDIGNYLFEPTLRKTGYILGANPVLVNGTADSRLANPFVTWETMRSVNLGVDIGVLKNRVEFTADLYKSNTDGLLLNVNIPGVSGFETALQNIGEVQNKGIELSVSSRNFVDKFKWNTSFNIAFNRNKVLALGGAAGDFIDDGFSRSVVGKPLGQFYTRVTDGIFNTQAEIAAHVPQDNNPRPGDRRFKDVNNDGRVDNNDLAFTGDPNANFTYGFTNSFSFKNFDLNAVINGSYGNDIYFADPAGINVNGNVNNTGDVRNRWRSPENPGSGNMPAAVFGFTTLSDVASDYKINDGSFLRLTNLTLGYNLPQSLAKKIRTQNTRLYLGGQNIFTLSKNYPGFDPETGSNNTSPLSQGVDSGIYPIARVFTFGLNVTF